MEQLVSTILLVDSDASLQIQRTLEESLPEAQIVVVERPAGAIRRIEQEPVDLILLDLSLPDGYGPATVRRLRRRWPNIPIVVLTDTDGDDLVSEAVGAGAQDFLRKGATSREMLIRCIRYAIGRGRLDAQLRDREAEVIHMQRVTIVAQMAAGIAHELNQPLSAISNYAHASINRLGSSRPDCQAAIANQRRIGDLAVKAGDIIRRMQEFVRWRAPKREWTDINDVVRESLELVKRFESPHGISISRKLGQNLPFAWCDRVQLEQVTVNLLRNAIQAMKRSAAESHSLEVTSKQPADDCIQVEVRDTGIGIAVEQLANIFAPFRSSRAEGMGIGLAISRSIIEAHGGRLWAKPNRNRGMTFRFSVPVAAVTLPEFNGGRPAYGRR